MRTSARSFRGEYRLIDGTFEARNLQAEVLGGHVAADLTMLHLADKPEARLRGNGAWRFAGSCERRLAHEAEGRCRDHRPSRRNG